MTKQRKELIGWLSTRIIDEQSEWNANELTIPIEDAKKILGLLQENAPEPVQDANWLSDFIDNELKPYADVDRKLVSFEDAEYVIKEAVRRSVSSPQIPKQEHPFVKLAKEQEELPAEMNDVFYDNIDELLESPKQEPAPDAEGCFWSIRNLAGAKTDSYITGCSEKVSAGEAKIMLRKGVCVCERKIKLPTSQPKGLTVENAKRLLAAKKAIIADDDMTDVYNEIYWIAESFSDNIYQPWSEVERIAELNDQDPLREEEASN